MSGGRWNYMQHKFDDAVEESSLYSESLRLLGQIEHELDWGHSCDTCLDCARLRVASALDQFYDDGAHATAAIAILRDSGNARNYCDRCLDGMDWALRPNARPTRVERDAEVVRRLA